MKLNQIYSLLKEYNKSKIFHLILMALAIFLVYTISLKNDFVWDDKNFILDSFDKNYSLEKIIKGEQTDFKTGVYRPVRNLFYPVSFFLFQDNPVGYHFQAILIHLSLSILIWNFIFLICKKNKDSKLIATVFTLIWALNPLQVEAVAWASSSMDLISFIFGFLAILVFINHKPKENNSYFLLFGLVLLALFSNEISLGLPLVLISIFILKLTKYSWNKNKILIIVVLNYFIYFLVRSSYIPTLSRMPVIYDNFFESFLLSSLVTAKYIWNFLLPINLSPDQLIINDLPGLLFLNVKSPESLPNLVDNPFTYLSIFTHIFLMFLGWWGYKNNKLITLGVLWFYAFIFPVSQILPQPIIYANRYGFLASLGIVLIFVGLFELLFKKFKFEKSIFLITVAIIFLFSALSFNYISIWKNENTLWSYALNKNSSSAVSFNQLALASIKNGDYQTAKSFYDNAIEINPNIDFYHKNKIFMEIDLKNFTEAIKLTENYLNKFGVTNDIEIIADNFFRANQIETSLNLYKISYAKFPSSNLKKKIALLEQRI